MIFCQECGRQIRLDISRLNNPWYHVDTDITDHEAEFGDS